jgi:hypothetical protein
MQDATNKAAHYWRIDEKGQVMKHKVRIRTCLVNEVMHACMHALIPMYATWSHYSREGHHWRFKTPLHWRILNRHNQLGSDELITSLPVMPNRQ